MTLRHGCCASRSRACIERESLEIRCINEAPRTIALPFHEPETRAELHERVEHPNVIAAFLCGLREHFEQRGFKFRALGVGQRFESSECTDRDRRSIAEHAASRDDDLAATERDERAGGIRLRMHPRNRVRGCIGADALNDVECRADFTAWRIELDDKCVKALLTRSLKSPFDGLQCEIIDRARDGDDRNLRGLSVGRHARDALCVDVR